jgi:serine phosphatase RsbU (regulator of sigma subunit)
LFLTIAAYLHRLGRQRSAFFDLARAQRDELADEVALAAEVQHRMLEPNRPAGLELDFHARTDLLKGVGGDYYDLWSPTEGQAAVVVADVAGKGLPAALLMPALRIAVRSSVSPDHPPTRVVAEVNASLCETTETSNYATMFFATLTLDGGQLDYVNAGHLPGLLVDAAGEVHWLREGGIPVGLLPDARYESACRTLGADDLLVLCSDGIWEAEDASGEQFGPDHLARAVVAARDRPAREIVDAVHREWELFTGGAEATDDTTLIVLRRNGDSVSSSVSGSIV